MEKTCFIIGAGDFDGLLRQPAEGDLVIAADGGFRRLAELGMDPDIVLGDFDSLGYVPDHPNLLQVPSEKDDTDMLLALKTGLSRGYSSFHLYGGLGGARLDHSLANLQSLHFVAVRGARAYLIGGGAVVTAIRNGEIRFPSTCRGYVSVFCAGSPAEGVTLEGLKYELRDGTLCPDMPLGVSNEFQGVPARAAVRNGTLLVTWQADNPIFF